MASKTFQSPQSNISSYQGGSTSLGDRAVSPSRAKISQLSERLSNMQMQVDEDRTLKKEVFEQRLKTLDEKVVKASQQDEAKFKAMREQMSKVQEVIHESKSLRDANDERVRQKDIKSLDLGIQKEITKDRLNRKDYEGRILKQADDRIYQVRLEIARQKKVREESEESNAQELGDRILHLQDEVEGERRAREEQNQVVIRSFGDQILALQEQLTKERRQREDAQSQMFSMLDEMNTILNTQLQNEKRQRETTEDTLLRLLDETCNKVENALRK